MKTNDPSNPIEISKTCSNQTKDGKISFDNNILFSNTVSAGAEDDKCENGINNNKNNNNSGNGNQNSAGIIINIKNENTNNNIFNINNFHASNGVDFNKTYIDINNTNNAIYNTEQTSNSKDQDSNVKIFTNSMGKNDINANAIDASNVVEGTQTNTLYCNDSLNSTHNVWKTSLNRAGFVDLSNNGSRVGDSNYSNTTTNKKIQLTENITFAVSSSSASQHKLIDTKNGKHIVIF